MSEVDVFDALKYRIEIDSFGVRRSYNAAGMLHHENAPAVVWPGGTKEWYQTGLRHRTDGPAVEWSGGYKEYWVDGSYYYESEFNAKFLNNLNGKIVEIDGKQYRLTAA